MAQPPKAGVGYLRARGAGQLHIRAPDPPSAGCCWVILATTDCTGQAAETQSCCWLPVTLTIPPTLPSDSTMVPAPAAEQ